MLILNLLKTKQKNSREKCYLEKSDRKIEFLTYITVFKSFQPITFLEDFFFQWFWTQLKFWILWHPHQILIKILLVKLALFCKPFKTAKNLNIFYKYVLESHFTTLGGATLSKAVTVSRRQNSWNMFVTELGHFKKADSYVCFYGLFILCAGIKEVR